MHIYARDNRGCPITEIFGTLPWIVFLDIGKVVNTMI